MERKQQTIDNIIITETKGSDIVEWLCLIHQRRNSRKLKFEQLKKHKGEIQAIVKRGRFDHQINRRIYEEIEWLQCPRHHLIPFTDPLYPPLLRQISDPPLALYAIGDTGLLSEPQIAIVGSRRPTPVGHKCAQQIAQELAQFGLVITSGLALGIDGVAHRGALGVEGGRSIAVLAHGLDSLYPPRHEELFQCLCAHGLVLSEYPFGVVANKYRFPERNRIVSGLSLGVIVVEAAERSGTLITARLAIEQNRELMVVPGSALSAQYQGSHRLIQQGAALVSNARDVLVCLASEIERVFNISANKEVGEQKNKRALSFLDFPLLQYIGAESTSIDEIIISSGLAAGDVASQLLSMEVEGLVATSLDGGYVNLT